MSSLIVNDIFDELKSENQRLENQLIFVNKCLNVLFKFKTNLMNILNLSTSSEKICLTSEDIQLFQDIDEEYKSLYKVSAKEDNQNTNQLTEKGIKPFKDNNYSKNGHKKNYLNELSDWIQLSNNQLNNSKRTYGKRVDNMSAQQKTNVVSIPINSKPLVSSTVLSTIRPQTIASNIESTEETIIKYKCNINECNSEYQSQKESHEIYYRYNCKNCGTGYRSLKAFESHRRAGNFGTDQKANTESSERQNSESLLQQKNLSEQQKTSQIVSNIGSNPLNTRPVGQPLAKISTQTICSNIKSIKITSKELNNESVDSNSSKETTTHLNLTSNECNPKSNIKSKEKIKEFKYNCLIKGCDFKCVLKCEYYPHMKECHKDVEPYKCKICGKCFATQMAFRKHFKSVHVHAPNTIKCDVGCDKYFRTYSARSAHRVVHSDEKPFKCDVNGCDYRAKNKERVTYHKKYVHLNVRKFLCVWPECGKAFKSDFHLKIHHRFHTNERPYLCDWPECGKGFRAKENLKLHYRIHTNEKPYVCDWPGCGHRWSHFSNLIQHKRIHTKS